MKKGNQGGPLFLVCIGYGMTPCTVMGHGKLSKLRGWRGKRGDGIDRGRRGWGGEGALSVTQVPSPLPAMCTWEAVGQAWFILKETISVPCYLPALPALSSLRELKHEVHRAIFTSGQGHLASKVSFFLLLLIRAPAFCLPVTPCPVSLKLTSWKCLHLGAYTRVPKKDAHAMGALFSCNN